MSSFITTLSLIFFFPLPLMYIKYFACVCSFSFDSSTTWNKSEFAFPCETHESFVDDHNPVGEGQQPSTMHRVEREISISLVFVCSKPPTFFCVCCLFDSRSGFLRSTSLFMHSLLSTRSSISLGSHHVSNREQCPRQTTSKRRAVRP